MKRNFFKTMAIVLSIICAILVGVLIYMKLNKNSQKTKTSELSDKGIDEISFIDYNVIDAMNKLNNISVLRYKVYSKNVNINENSSNVASKKSNYASNDNEQNQKQQEEQESDSSSNQDAEESNSDNGSSSLTQSNSSETTNVGESSGESDTILVNSLTESDNSDIDWNYITSIYENIYSTWPTTQNDLKRLGVNTEYLDNVNVDLNGIAQSILNKDKNSCLVNFYNLYAQIPNYLAIITRDNYLINLYNTKLAILNAYTLANSENKWNEMSSSIRAARQNFYSVMEVSRDNESDKINLERINSMLQNLENAVALNNKNIFFMQYKNVIQELENI